MIQLIDDQNTYHYLVPGIYNLNNTMFSDSIFQQRVTFYLLKLKTFHCVIGVVKKKRYGLPVHKLDYITVLFRFTCSVWAMSLSTTSESIANITLRYMSVHGSPNCRIDSKSEKNPGHRPGKSTINTRARSNATLFLINFFSGGERAT